MLGLFFNPKLDCWSCIVSIAKIGALIRCLNVFFWSSALFLYKSITKPCMDYYFHVWADSTNWFLNILDKLKKQVQRIVGPTVAAFLEILTPRQNEASSKLFYEQYFGKHSSGLVQMVPLPYFCRVSSKLSYSLHNFSVTIPE